MALFESEIKDLLEAQGFQDSAPASPTFWLGVEQDSPDFAVTVLPESGAAPNRRIGEFPSFSVRVRHSSSTEANDVMRLIFEFLQEFQGRLGSTPLWGVGRIRADADRVQLGRDQSSGRGRWAVQQTFSAIVRFTTQ